MGNGVRSIPTSKFSFGARCNLSSRVSEMHGRSGSLESIDITPSASRFKAPGLLQARACMAFPANLGVGFNQFSEWILIAFTVRMR